MQRYKATARTTKTNQRHDADGPVLLGGRCDQFTAHALFQSSLLTKESSACAVAAAAQAALYPWYHQHHGAWTVDGEGKMK